MARASPGSMVPAPRSSPGASSPRARLTSSPRTDIAPGVRLTWTSPTSSCWRAWGRRRRCGCSEDQRWGLLASDRFHLAQSSKAPERVVLDLADSLAGQSEPPADLLERLRLGVVEAVAEDQDLPFTVSQRGER